ncbi:hypothetical protein CRE_04223 [Caenorhabditis remanei]|uniref:VWFA domain-containing protein n=1 Tax=Caenorhabditis remanei TaxID=31234 RepID=E3MYT2_CAERE|nr:hypothetical protein CRE_04223 [Caenorhabditis remanei]
MRIFIFLIFFLVIQYVYADHYTPYSSLSYVDRPCGTDLSNLWLDVVLVVDNSEEMGSQRLFDVAANIIDVFGANTRIGSNSSEPITTRVGLITYNFNATLNANLSQFQSYDDLSNGVFHSLSNVTNSTDSFIGTGLAMAEQLLRRQNFNTTRDHYKKVIIVYASAFQRNEDETPEWIADRLKGSGVKIITVGYGNSHGLIKSLSNIASPGLSFNSSGDGNLINQIQTSLLQGKFQCNYIFYISISANCYCPSTWIQYTSSYSNSSSYHYGLCIQPVPTLTTWRMAHYACIFLGNHSSLATEYNQDKHDFLLDAVKDTSGFSPPYQYHIGLMSNSYYWGWDPPTGSSGPTLQSWSNWILGFQGDTEARSVINIESENLKEGTTGWLNIDDTRTKAGYVCESYACDTDNYCHS